MEQPREPKIFPNEVYFPAGASGNAEKTLQSIDGTLKRIEAILLEKKNPLRALQDAVEDSASQLQGQPLVLCPCSQDLLRQPAPTNSRTEE